MKTVLITGASKGIGFETARRFANNVANVILTGRSEVHLIEAQKKLKAEFPLVTFYIFTCDHSSSTSVYQLLNALTQLGLTITHLILNVGYNQVHEIGPKKIERVDETMLLKAYNTNILNAHILVVYFLKNIKQQGGAIIFLGSQAYKYGVKGQLAYNITKAALVGYKNSIVSEYATKNIFCGLINPGVVLNERTKSLRRQISGVQLITEEEVALAIEKLVFSNAYQNGVELDI